LKRAVEDKASRLPTVVECVKRSGILDYQLIQQCYLEEALIERALHDGKIIERRSDAPAQAILMVRVAKEAMRAERAKRVERRSSAAA
jgi:hypothetical protein